MPDLQVKDDVFDGLCRDLTRYHVCGPECRVSGEGDLFFGGEDADIVATVSLLVREDEGGFGVVNLSCYLLQVGVRQMPGSPDDGQLVAGVFLFGEDVDDGSALQSWTRFGTRGPVISIVPSACASTSNPPIL